MEEALYRDVLDVIVDLRAALKKSLANYDSFNQRSGLATPSTSLGVVHEQGPGLSTQLGMAVTTLEKVLNGMCAQFTVPPAIGSLLTRKLGDVMESAHHLQPLLGATTPYRVGHSLLASSHIAKQSGFPGSNESEKDRRQIVRAHQVFKRTTRNLEDAQRLLRIAYPHISFCRSPSPVLSQKHKLSNFSSSTATTKSPNDSIYTSSHFEPPLQTGTILRMASLLHDVGTAADDTAGPEDSANANTSLYTASHDALQPLRALGIDGVGEASGRLSDSITSHPQNRSQTREYDGRCDHSDSYNLGNADALWFYDSEPIEVLTSADAVHAISSNSELGTPSQTTVRSYQNPPFPSQLSSSTLPSGLPPRSPRHEALTSSLSRSSTANSCDEQAAQTTSPHIHRMTGTLWNGILAGSRDKLSWAFVQDILELFNYGEPQPQLQPDDMYDLRFSFGEAKTLYIRFMLRHSPSLTASDIDLRIGVFSFPEVTALYEAHAKQQKLARTAPAALRDADQNHTSTTTGGAPPRSKRVSFLDEALMHAAPSHLTSLHAAKGTPPPLPVPRNGSSSPVTTSLPAATSPQSVPAAEGIADSTLSGPSQRPDNTLTPLKTFLQSAPGAHHYRFCIPGLHWEHVIGVITEAGFRAMLTEELAEATCTFTSCIQCVTFSDGNLIVDIDIHPPSGGPTRAEIDETCQTLDFPNLRRVYTNLCMRDGLDPKTVTTLPDAAAGSLDMGRTPTAMHLVLPDRALLDQEEDAEAHEGTVSSVVARCIPRVMSPTNSPTLHTLSRVTAVNPSERLVANADDVAVHNTLDRSADSTAPNIAALLISRKKQQLPRSSAAYCGGGTAPAITTRRSPSVQATRFTPTPTTCSSTVPTNTITPASEILTSVTPPAVVTVVSTEQHSQDEITVKESASLHPLSMVHDVPTAVVRVGNNHVGAYTDEEVIPESMQGTTPPSYGLVDDQTTTDTSAVSEALHDTPPCPRDNLASSVASTPPTREFPTGSLRTSLMPTPLSAPPPQPTPRHTRVAAPSGKKPWSSSAPKKAAARSATIEPHVRLTTSTPCVVEKMPPSSARGESSPRRVPPPTPEPQPHRTTAAAAAARPKALQADCRRQRHHGGPAPLSPRAAAATNEAIEASVGRGSGVYRRSTPSAAPPRDAASAKPVTATHDSAPLTARKQNTASTKAAPKPFTTGWAASVPSKVGVAAPVKPTVNGHPMHRSHSSPVTEDKTHRLSAGGSTRCQSIDWDRDASAVSLTKPTTKRTAPSCAVLTTISTAGAAVPPVESNSAPVTPHASHVLESPPITPLTPDKKEDEAGTLGLAINEGEGALTVGRGVSGLAQAAGFQHGDVLRTVNGKIIRSRDDLLATLAMSSQPVAFVTVMSPSGEVVTRRLHLNADATRSSSLMRARVTAPTTAYRTHPHEASGSHVQRVRAGANNSETRSSVAKYVELSVPWQIDPQLCANGTVAPSTEAAATEGPPQPLLYHFASRTHAPTSTVGALHSGRSNTPATRSQTPTVANAGVISNILERMERTASSRSRVCSRSLAEMPTVVNSGRRSGSAGIQKCRDRQSLASPRNFFQNGAVVGYICSPRFSTEDV